MDPDNAIFQLEAGSRKSDAALQRNTPRGFNPAAAPDLLPSLAGTEPRTAVIGMAEMDGFALLKTVRATFAPEELPAVAITAFSRAEDRVRAVEAGFQAYLMKPYDIGELITLIRDISAA